MEHARLKRTHFHRLILELSDGRRVVLEQLGQAVFPLLQFLGSVMQQSEPGRTRRFDPGARPRVGGQVRINTGQFEGYSGPVIRVDEHNRVIYFSITVFQRSVELSLDFDTAATILDVLN
jgi:transcription antitermination factor NusG